MKKPFLVVVLGCDGSGKSTLIKKITKNLVENNFKSKDYHFLPSFIENKRKSKVVLNPYDKKNWPKIISFLKIIYIIAIYNFFNYLYVPFFERDLDVILFDRYFYDIAICKKRYRLNLPKKLIVNFFNYVPAPDCIFYINTNIKNCLIRTDDIIDQNYIINENKDYSDLSKDLLNFYEIDGNLSLKSVEENAILILEDLLNKK